ncbi:DNA polymerase III subunit alpha [Candidatus Parcubacteria bacterium]|nr:MAG: DNA polymerase III subunit alpha [Candidatus Parcubacteria bacterium]
MKFVHLHVHSHYSLLDGLTKIDELVAAAKENGAEAIALTDHGVMYGAIEFYQKCQKAGIKPIIGVEAYLAPHSRFDKTKSDEKSFYHLLLLAKNSQGYKNLIKLTTIAHLEGYYYKPRIDWEVLKKYSQGLIASTACLGGEIPRLILSNQLEKARRRILEYNQLFGQGNFYLEIMPHLRLEGQAKVNQYLIKFSQELNIPLVLTNDIHYLKEEDAEAQDILLCIQNKKKRSDKDRMMMDEGNYSFRSVEDMVKELGAGQAVLEAAANTVKIAQQCDVEIELGKIQLPYFPVPEGYDGDTYLREMCLQGIQKRYQKSYSEVNREIRERMDYELSVIKRMGWSSYFLIVADFVNWAKNNGIVVGPGRGSAAGSLVCYLTGITNLDPLKYGLLFERFLNPDRVSMPDIDMDFADNRRDEVIRYVEKKYGQDRVAQIITFGTMAARAAVRDVGRVLDYPYDYCDKLAKMIPMFMSLEKAVETVAELKEVYEKEEAARNIINYAKRLEGVARHASTHACGVVITRQPLTEMVPLQYASSSDRTVVTQYSLHPIEDLGLLKMDFLGLKNLTIIESAIKIIKNTRGLKIDIDKIPLDDPKTYELFQKGQTTGFFQFESSGMRRYLRELKPTEFEDIVAMVALYRPGPMEWIPDYIAGKHGRKKPRYLHPKLRPILEKTYGVVIYQEQVMQMARDLAGFSMAEADVLRKAVGKKIPELLAKQKEKFIDGCVKNGINRQLAEKIFSFIEPFAGYGFNRSHAACYALIGYQTAYLKAHWPTEFMAALLTADQHNIDKIAVEINECRNMGIEVKQPDINQSFDSFTVVTSGTEVGKIASQNEEPKVIRFGLKAIKNVGDHIVDVIIAERKANGPYKNIYDFLERIDDKDLNKKSLESLIKSGALDQFGDRGVLMQNIEALLKFHRDVTEAKHSRQSSLFSDMPLVVGRVKLANFPPVERQEKLKWEKELLGLYITEHPFLDYHKLLREEVELLPLSELGLEFSNQMVNVAGIITAVKKIITRNNQSMLFVKIEDNISSVEVLVFPSLYQRTKDIWEDGRAVLCRGKVSDKEQEIKILADVAVGLELEKIKESLSSFLKQVLPANGTNGKASFVPSQNFNSPKPLNVWLEQELSAKQLASLRQILANYTGRSRVYFYVRFQGGFRKIESSFRVNNHPDLHRRLKQQFGNSLRLNAS